MTGEQPPTEPSKPCRACGREIPHQAQTCPHCGQAQAPQEAGARGGLRPLGGLPAGTSGERPVPPRVAPPPPTGTTSAPRGPASGRPSADARQRNETSRRQHAEGLVAYAKQVVKSDPWFAVLMVWIGLATVYYFLTGRMFAGVVGSIVFWGLLTFNYWVYIIVVVLCGLSLLQGLISLVMGAASLEHLIGLAFLAAVLVVLLNRHEHYM